ncbi:MAG: RNA-binding protein [Acidilobus sp.]
MPEAQQSLVLVGKKPMVNYVLAIIEAFTNNPNAEVVVKARGNAICKAVDTISTVKNRYFKDVYVKSFGATYEDVKTEKGPVKLPAVEIVIGRSQQSQT